MEIIFYKSFHRDIKKIKDQALKSEIQKAVMNVTTCANVNQITNCKKMKAAENAYRIKTKNYRIGFYLNANTVEFAAFDHRKDIYKKFP